MELQFGFEFEFINSELGKFNRYVNDEIVEDKYADSVWACEKLERRLVKIEPAQ